jgi:hypothetical protein
MSRASDALRGGQGSGACGGQALDPYLEFVVLGWNNAKRMWRLLTRFFWFTIALIFVVEAWLWDHLEPIVERCVALLPLRALKHLVAEQVEDLSPPATLFVFAVPAALLFPLKLLAIWLIAHEQWFGALVTIVFAKLFGLGVTSFLFAVTRDKLLQMDWFRAAYEKVVEWRALAQQLVEPFRLRIQNTMQQLRSESVSRFWRLVMRIRHRAQTVR